MIDSARSPRGSLRAPLRWGLPIRAALALLVVLTGAAEAKRLVLAPHIAPIFDQGRTWTFDTASTHWGDPDMKTTSTSRGKVTCKVESASVTAKRALAKVTCDLELRKLNLAGYWVANARGLYYIGFPDDPPPTEEAMAALAADTPHLPAKPKAFEKVTRTEAGPDTFANLIEGLRASAKSGGWCVYGDTSKFIDGGRVVQCFAPGSGFESGYNDVGGELDRFEYAVRTTAVRR